MVRKLILQKLEAAMNKHHFRQILALSCVLVILVIAFMVPPGAMANVRVGGAGEPPFYARLERGIIYTDGKQVAVVFYRPPDCIPADFNLLDFFDFENVWGCLPATTEGFAVVKDPTANDPPIQQVLHGLGAVPLWFVSLEEYEQAIADDVLTIGELRSLPSLEIGYASYFKEVLHPMGGPSHHIEFNARGKLENGKRFKVHVLFSEGHFDVSIKFRQ
jgi:hypothetical protein